MRAVGRSSAWPYEIEGATEMVNYIRPAGDYQPGRKISTLAPPWLNLTKGMAAPKALGLSDY